MKKQKGKYEKKRKNEGIYEPEQNLSLTKGFQRILKGLKGHQRSNGFKFRWSPY